MISPTSTDSPLPAGSDCVGRLRSHTTLHPAVLSRRKRWRSLRRLPAGGTPGVPVPLAEDTCSRVPAAPSHQPAARLRHRGCLTLFFPYRPLPLRQSLRSQKRKWGESVLSGGSRLAGFEPRSSRRGFFCCRVRSV